MTAQIFDGLAYAEQKLQNLQEKMRRLSLIKPTTATPPKIVAVYFKQDAGSLLYTQKKQAMAKMIGIEYAPMAFSINDKLAKIKDFIQSANQDKSVTGIIIQKPWQKTFFTHWQRNDLELADEQNLVLASELAVAKNQNLVVNSAKKAYQAWWKSLVETLALNKDVDGLHPISLQAVKDNTWQEQSLVLPATCLAVWEIIQQIPAWQTGQLITGKVVILGRSDLLGKPLYYLLKNKGLAVELLGSKHWQERVASRLFLKDADLVVSATGQHGLITGEMIKTGSALIDVGEPLPDLDFASVQKKASFVTPVPGGVGPVTVACLMDNSLSLWDN